MESLSDRCRSVDTMTAPAADIAHHLDGIQMGLDDIGEPDEDGDVGATARSEADAPEIDGNVFLRNVPASLSVGDIVDAVIEDADEHDLFGVAAE